MSDKKNISSPTIDEIEWGRVRVDGKDYKDAKLFPGGVREWDWRETGTHHVPGIQPADVTELIESGARRVVLSRGFWNRLQVCPETLDLLRHQGIEFDILETGDAVDTYNRLAAHTTVAALIHSTC